MCSLATNIASFVHLLNWMDFSAMVDHLVLTHIIRIKEELATSRIKRLLESLSSYSFNLYYIKGKDMILSDFYLDRSMMIAIQTKLYLFHLICKVYYKIYFII